MADVMDEFYAALGDVAKKLGKTYYSVNCEVVTWDIIRKPLQQGRCKSFSGYIDGFLQSGKFDQWQGVIRHFEQFILTDLPIKPDPEPMPPVRDTFLETDFPF